MAFAPTVAALALCVILANCGAARPVKYYTLVGTPSASSSNAAAPIPVTLLLGHITAPHLYRDDRIVYGMGPVELGEYEDHRWAEMPTDMIEQVLLNDLRAAGQYRDVERQSSNAKGDYVLRGHLIALDEVDTPAMAARFAMEVELFDPKAGGIVWSQTYSHDEPVNGKKIAVIVEAMQTNVHAGVQQLVSALGQYVASHPRS
jgi:ABC-type uncharacterized transport system auxiliary subunit